MGRRCSVCDHADRKEIDTALLDGEAYRSIAQRFAASPDAVFRHKRDHLPASMAKASEAQAVVRGDGLLARLHELTDEARAIKIKAEKKGDLRTALAGVRELVRIVELLAKLQGELDERPVVNVLVAPEWVALRVAILAALEPHPEARTAVCAALQVVEGHAGQ